MVSVYGFLWRFVELNPQFYLFLSFFLLFFYSEPNAPPFNVQGHNTSSSSILVQWGDVPAAAQNGIILRYTVTYSSLPGGSTRTKVVNSPTTKAILTGLNKYTNYSITVFASTSKGDGNVSEPIVVVTDESSKFIFVCKYEEKKNWHPARPNY